jgi:ABC-2 type transport system ATP-binding protein
MGMLGPSGAGKTTIIRMIMGVFAPDSGQISVALDGTLNNKLDKRRIGYLPEGRCIWLEP